MWKYTDVFLQNLLCLHSSQVVAMYDIVISRTVLVAMRARSRMVSQRSMQVLRRYDCVTCTWVAVGEGRHVHTLRGVARID